MTTTLENRPRSTPAEKCTFIKRDGERCGNWPLRGATICIAHGARRKTVAARALVRAEVMDWGLNDEHVDPGEILLRLVSQSARRAAFYASLLAEAYAAEEKNALEAAAAAEAAGEERRLGVPVPPGVAALIGKTFRDAGDGGIYPSGEAIRGLVDLEMRERKLCSDFASKAIAAGLAERQVRLAEQQSAFIVAAVMIGLDRAGVQGPARLEAQDAIADYLEGLGA